MEKHQISKPLPLPGSGASPPLLGRCCHSACKTSPTAKAKCFPLQGFDTGSKAGSRFGTGLSPPCPQTQTRRVFDAEEVPRQLVPRAAQGCGFPERSKSLEPKICNAQVSLTHTKTYSLEYF